MRTRASVRQLADGMHISVAESRVLGFWGSQNSGRGQENYGMPDGGCALGQGAAPLGGAALGGGPRDTHGEIPLNAAATCGELSQGGGLTAKLGKRADP